jgi:hypothetical protein
MYSLDRRDGFFFRKELYRLPYICVIIDMIVLTICLVIESLNLRAAIGCILQKPDVVVDCIYPILAILTSALTLFVIIWSFVLYSKSRWGLKKESTAVERGSTESSKKILRRSAFDTYVIEPKTEDKETDSY